MIVDVGIFIAVMAVFTAAYFFAICLAMALIGLVGYLLFGAFLYITSARFRHDVHTLLIEVVKMSGRAVKRSVQWAAYSSMVVFEHYTKTIFHPVTTLRGQKKSSKYIVQNASTKRSSRDGSSWTAGEQQVLV